MVQLRTNAELQIAAHPTNPHKRGKIGDHKTCIAHSYSKIILITFGFYLLLSQTNTLFSFIKPTSLIMSNELYQKYVAQSRKISDVNAAIALMHWDQEIYIPKNATGLRAQQIATLSGILHEMACAPEFGQIMKSLTEASDLDTAQTRNIKDSYNNYQRRTKLSKDFVMKMSDTTSRSFHAWHKAKAEKDFSIFAPLLKEMVMLKREQAETLGYEDHPYDALMEEYEPGERVAKLDPLFADVRQKLVGFVQEIAQQEQVDDSFLYKHYNKDKQWDYGIQLLKQMGYDFNHGRQDIAAHPFTIDFGSHDVRVTTRIKEDNVAEMIWSCIHEGGHALYEQGLLIENYGLPTGAAISLGIHESQSRLWENNVGRSLPYWKANFAGFKSIFPEQLQGVDVQSFYKGINKVEPSFIRTSADELTYHFHILIRYEIEKALVEGSVAVEDLPSVWNQKYKDYLNVDVPSDDMGVLQDVHWSHGSLGYFPTYSLGSFYAAQFYQQACKEVDDLEAQIANGNMMPMLDWLREKIHQHGRLYTADELCNEITGESLNFDYFMDYARDKYANIYGLQSVTA